MDEIYAREAIRRRLIDAVAALPEATRAVFCCVSSMGSRRGRSRGASASRRDGEDAPEARPRGGARAARTPRIDRRQALGGVARPRRGGSGAAPPRTSRSRGRAHRGDPHHVDEDQNWHRRGPDRGDLGVFVANGAGRRARGGETAGGAARSEPPWRPPPKRRKPRSPPPPPRGRPHLARVGGLGAGRREAKVGIPHGGLRVKAVWKDGKAPAPAWACGSARSPCRAATNHNKNHRRRRDRHLSGAPRGEGARGGRPDDRERPRGDPGRYHQRDGGRDRAGGRRRRDRRRRPGLPIEGAGVWISETHLSATSRLELGKTAADGRFTVRSLGKEVFLGAELESRTPPLPRS